MKAKLVKKADGWYNLYDGEIGIGSTHEELQQPYKLSIANCDEIFGVVDEDKKNLYYYKQVMNPYETGGQSYTAYEKGFIEGFNKAMELNKDKSFTLEDLRTAMTYGVVQEGTGFEGIHSVDDLFDLILKKVSQPTEIGVEILMRNSRTGSIVKHDSDLEWDENGLCDRAIPKLDPNGCLILKKM